MCVGFLHMQRQIDAERKRQQVKKVASAKLEKLLTKKAEVRLLSTVSSSHSPPHPHTPPSLSYPPPSHHLTLIPPHPHILHPHTLLLTPSHHQLQRNKNELEGTMRKIFSSVFVHRYRDVRPEVRALCIAELGSWMMEYRYAKVMVELQ